MGAAVSIIIGGPITIAAACEQRTTQRRRGYPILVRVVSASLWYSASFGDLNFKYCLSCGNADSRYRRSITTRPSTRRSRVRVPSLPPISRTSGGKVTFAPGARSAWHTHPLGQTLIVTEGTGWIQQWGGPIEEIRKADVIWIPPGVKHWHGATPNTAMTHIAIQEQFNGKAVEWMEKVTDDQHRN
jgi:quercetin dioxygenase-like cupin family protein